MIWQINDDGFVALKRAAKDRRMETQKKGCQKPALQQKTTDDNDDDDTMKSHNHHFHTLDV